MFTLDKIYKEALVSLDTLCLMGGLVAAVSFLFQRQKNLPKQYMAAFPLSRTSHSPPLLSEFLAF